MDVFDHFNQGTKCPICGNNNDAPAVLIPIEGTENGGIVEAQQFHLHCIKLTFMKDINVVAMAIHG